ncbi:methyltransferase domain-containing protein [Pseudoalteromonas sp. T1lg65]|uniref:methyltransferase domain-containing protein n=1 Tax=Pseudoalteromonas sp. T1lg65 TaxID=2077101 RepID=UPI003F79AF2D
MLSSQSQIKDRFSNAAQQYSQHAKVQLRAAEYLFDRLNNGDGKVRLLRNNLLDLGCGPHQNHSSLRKLARCYVGMDLSTDMLRQGAKEAQGVCADMDSLPLLDKSISFIFSNFAIQWSKDPQRLFQELYRVCEEQGKVLLSTVLDGSLKEINLAWQGVDNCSHVNSFKSLQEIEWFAKQAGFQLNWSTQRRLCDNYQTALDALKSVKNIGANNVLSSKRRQGLLSKSAYKRLIDSYPSGANGFDVTYEVGFMELVR